MRMGNNSINIMIIIISFSLNCIFLSAHAHAHAHAYNNYTVGDSLGWYDALENPKVDYRKWTADKNFSLGDFLIFNTDNNHSIIQTYNFTTYKLCDYNDALDNDILEWSSDDPSSTAPHSISVAVPLVKVGMTYFFSSDYDGEQCLNGQRLQINVTYGQGLPPSLRSESDDGSSPSPVMSPESSGDDESAPDTLVPSNFDDPKDTTTTTSTSDDDHDMDGVHHEPSTSSSLPLSTYSKLHGLMAIAIGFFFPFLLTS